LRAGPTPNPVPSQHALVAGEGEWGAASPASRAIVEREDGEEGGAVAIDGMG
jgi:hypothetical protein